jgi:[glutamine synthetase] adenylyltransferase / [glutamine synthetase]-adenylyl-L-tyrosine phosphorylase
VLNYANKYPKMTKWSDNVRILELATNYQIMDSQEAEQLTQAYINMRNKIHRLALQLQSSTVNSSQFVQEKQIVNQCWLKWLT